MSANNARKDLPVKWALKYTNVTATKFVTLLMFLFLTCFKFIMFINQFRSIFRSGSSVAISVKGGFLESTDSKNIFKRSTQRTKRSLADSRMTAIVVVRIAQSTA